MLRDEFDVQGLHEAGALMDDISSNRSGRNSASLAAMSWLEDGVGRGYIQARGVLEHGAVEMAISTPLGDTTIPKALGDIPEDVIVDLDCRVYRRLKFKKAGIKEYARWLGSSNENS